MWDAAMPHVNRLAQVRVGNTSFPLDLNLILRYIIIVRESQITNER